MKFKRKKKAPVKTFAEMTPEEKQTQMEKLAYLFERMRLGDYVNNFNRPWRVLYMNILSGIGRGVGLTIGATLVIAIIFKVISALISLNVPYLSDMMNEVKQTLESRYAGPRHKAPALIDPTKDAGKTVDKDAVGKALDTKGNGKTPATETPVRR